MIGKAKITNMTIIKLESRYNKRKQPNWFQHVYKMIQYKGGKGGMEKKS